MTQHPTYAPQARASIQSLPGSLIREVANSAMGRTDVLPFWFGESDQKTAEFIRAEASRSLAEGETMYSQNLGRPYLREAIAAYLSGLHSRPVEVDRIAAVSSGVTSILLATELLVGPQDRVVAITPLWPNICAIPQIFGATVERVPLSVRNGRWSLDLQRLIDALTPSTKLLIINSPNNPTGWTIDDEAVDAILLHCRRNGIWVLCDDVYERLVYDVSRRSAPSFLSRYEDGDRIISVNSFSKAWAMTGWRAGWMVVPKELTGDLSKLIEYSISCMFEPVQRAAALALRDGEQEVSRIRTIVSHSRTVLVDALKAVPGVEVPDAGGAMYAFFRVEGESNSLELAKRLVSDVGLGLAPGLAFGSEGDGWLRWCHAVSSDQRLLEGVERLETFLGRRRR
jgi:aspartate aminotransferase